MLQRPSVITRAQSSPDVVFASRGSPAKAARVGRPSCCRPRSPDARAAVYLPLQICGIRIWIPRSIALRTRLAVVATLIAAGWLVTGGLWLIVDCIAVGIRSSCPTYDGTAAELLASAGVSYSVDSEGCVSFCTASPNSSGCSPSSTFCSLYVVKYGGRAGNAFIQMAVGRLLARRRRAAFISPPDIEGFGSLPASFQASCPAAGYGAWPWMWHAPWALQVCAWEGRSGGW